MPGPWTALVRRSHPSVERRPRRLLVVVRTERLLLHGVEANRERLEELPVLCGKAVSKLPANQHDSALAEALQAICELDLSELESVAPPRGFGRD